MSPNEVKDIIYFALGKRPESVCYINMGVMNHKFSFVLSERKYVIRLYSASRSHVAGVEFELLSKAFAVGAKVPKVVHYAVKPTPFIIYEYIEGSVMSHILNECSMPEMKFLARDCVSNIKLLSNVKFPYFGNLESDIKFNTWQQYLQHLIVENEKFLSGVKSLTHSDILHIVSFMHSQIGRINYAYPSLVWSDFSFDNIIVKNKRVSGFVDFEGSMAGSPVLSLGYLLAKEGDTEVYRIVRDEMSKIVMFDENEILFYSLIRVLRISRYLKSPLPAGHKRDHIQ